MSEKKDPRGGTAFGNYGVDGMSLLDYFAGQALLKISPSVSGSFFEKPFFEIAEEAYCLAEKMIEEKYRREQAYRNNSD